MKPTFSPRSTRYKYTRKILKEFNDNECKIDELKSNLPNKGILKYPNIFSGEIVYGAKKSILEPWYSGKIVSVIYDGRFHVKFDCNEEKKLLTKKEIALFTQNPVQFPVGTRVIAKYDVPKEKSKYYSGVVAEPPKPQNRYRYMIFYDNGNAQYQHHNDIRLIVHKTNIVWTHVHPDNKDFIKGYLEKYPGRQMFNFTINQKIKVKPKGYQKYKPAKVLEVDCSIVKICFSHKNIECLYRGSLRIKISKKLNKSEKRKQIGQFESPHLIQPLVQLSREEKEIPSAIFKGVACKSTNKSSLKSSDETVKRNRSSSTFSHINMPSLPNSAILNKPLVQSSKAEEKLPNVIFKGGFAHKSTNKSSKNINDENVKRLKSSGASTHIDMFSVSNTNILNKPLLRISSVEEEIPSAIFKRDIARKSTNKSSSNSSDETVKRNRNSCTSSHIDMLSLLNPAILNKPLVQSSKAKKKLPNAIFKGGFARKSTNKSSENINDKNVKRLKSSSKSSHIDMLSLPIPAILNKPLVQSSKAKEKLPNAIFKGGFACNSTNKSSKNNSNKNVNRLGSSTKSSRINILSLPNRAHLNKPLVQSSKSEVEPPSAIFKEGVAYESTNKCFTYNSDEAVKCDNNSSKSLRIDMSSLPTLQPRRFVDHTCNHSCIEWTNYSYSKTKKICMMATPLFFGFTRNVENNNSNTYVVYCTPCGCSIWSMKEMLDYLFVTESEMTIDQFDFNSQIRPMAEFKETNTCLSVLEDISSGKEFRPITCVNIVNNELPSTFDYMTTRKPMLGVEINVDSNFLCGCDCTDNCQDKSKCACWKMTIEAQTNFPHLNNDQIIGYNYRRLSERVLTGIYECNTTCKCSSKCLNRVVQNPLSQNLQLFFSKEKGWGVRCLNDIPQGGFICIYVGQLFTEKNANEIAKISGDKYFAELDYIETVEVAKEGYESDVSIGNQENEGPLNSNAVSNNAKQARKRKKKPRLTSRKKSALKTKQKGNVKKNPKLLKSIRKCFGNNESVYIIDGMFSGNIGRYFNHSCCPNMFVQNVFVDTHDLRFPWVSFFALDYIKAGTELTWDYNYTVGSVPEMVLKCHCGSVFCRGRLL